MEVAVCNKTESGVVIKECSGMFYLFPALAQSFQQLLT